MQDDIINRVIKEANYIISTGATVRSTAKIFNYSKSTIHNDMVSRLKEIDTILFKKVRKVLQFNLSDRARRGGEATKRKYANKNI